MLRLILSVSLLILFLTGQVLMAETTIEWWQFWTDPKVRPVITSMVEEFENTHPDIKVNLTDLTWANGHEKIVVAFASGTAPDILELGSDWIAQFAATEKLADMTEMFADDMLDNDGWSMATYKDHIYARPWILGTRLLFGNRDLLRQADYDENFIPAKWDDLKQAAIKVHELGRDIYGWGSNTAEKHRLYKKYLPFFWSAGGQIFSDDGKLCILPSVYAVSALNFYKELHDSCGYVANQRGIEDAFLNGKIGFIISGDWLLKRIETEKIDFNLMSTIIPGPDFPGKSFLGGEFLAINKDSRNKEAAREFIDFICSTENQIRFCKANRSATSASKEARKDEYFSSTEHLQMFNRQILSVSHPPVDPDWVQIEDIIEEAVEKTLFEAEPPAEALRKAQMKIEQIKGL